MPGEVQRGVQPGETFEQNRTKIKKRGGGNARKAGGKGAGGETKTFAKSGAWMPIQKKRKEKTVGNSRPKELREGELEWGPASLWATMTKKKKRTRKVTRERGKEIKNQDGQELRKTRLAEGEIRTP